MRSGDRNYCIEVLPVVTNLRAPCQMLHGYRAALGAIDFYHSNYRELFVGAGRTLYNSRQVTWLEELYFAQATGSAAQSARYVWPWTLVDIRFTPQLTGEIVYFPYIPLNHSAHVQHVLERAKVEYAPSKAWKFGVAGGRR
jgi:hypothetical protein